MERAGRKGSLGRLNFTLKQKILGMAGRTGRQGFYINMVSIVVYAIYTKSMYCGIRIDWQDNALRHTSIPR
jgi:hypothetical protein